MKFNIWKDAKLHALPDLLEFIVDNRGKTVPTDPDGEHVLIATNCIRNENLYPSYEKIRTLNDETYQHWFRAHPEPGDIIFVNKGTPGRVCMVPDPVDFCIAQDMVALRVDSDVVYNKYLLAVLRSEQIQKQITATTVGDVIPHFKKQQLKDLLIPVPPMDIQKCIGDYYYLFCEKEELNKQINKNLQEQAQALYREMFVNTTNEQRRTCRAEEYFDIAIGKTPPRKEHQWFTTNPSDVTWVSISDMGSCGTYISRSSEQLTQEAIDKFNIKVVPSNTVLLSFKLTVGRIAITHGEMSTNEAIAHFKTDKSFINEYLYCYLKDFNYQTMGSTSSIAIAVNSKIIKAMPFVIPADDEISRFHSVVGPMFEQILNNQLENDSLAEMRDTLLPRLMSGELDVSSLDI